MRFASAFATATLDDTRGALAVFPRQHSRYDEVDAPQVLDELLPTPPAGASDPHTLPERLIHNILQQAFYAHDIERQCLLRHQG